MVMCDTESVTDARQPEPRLGAVRLSLTAAELAAATGGRLVHASDRDIRGGAVDSRSVALGNLFAALAGERTDGHRFLSDAVAAGASALIVADAPEAMRCVQAALRVRPDVTVVAVPDTLLGLHAAAAAWRSRFSPLVVGVTGSIAKTSTKEAVATVLEEGFVTLKSEGNANNEVGLPLTVLRMGPQHEAAVLEMGMYVGGEIAQLAAIARPQIGVVTAVREVHLSRIGSIEAVERAKAELIEALPPDGKTVLNADDFRVARMRARAPAAVLTYGFAAEADVRAEGVESLGLEGMAFRLVTPAGPADVRTPVLGRPGAHSGWGPAAVGLAAGMELEPIVAGLSRGWEAPHRDQIVRAGGLTVLDDSYNASPTSMIAALELLATLPGRHVAVLGEMLELGDAHERGHREVGEAAAGLLDELIVVGEAAAGIAAGAASLGEAVVSVPDREVALAVLSRRLRPGDVLLVKASRGAELDLIVDALVETHGGGQGEAATGRKPAARGAGEDVR
jgi:UDP-N-acetylmuramoyl-tripeptide--D-alanyl-D-alanine ligase